jgi:hypothetical protein
MTEKKRIWLELLLMCGYLIIPYFDAIYITQKMKDSGTLMEVQCHDDPKNCWIQVKDKRHE